MFLDRMTRTFGIDAVALIDNLSKPSMMQYLVKSYNLLPFLNNQKMLGEVNLILTSLKSSFALIWTTSR